MNSSNTNRPAGPAGAGLEAGGAEPAEDERAAAATVLPMIWSVHISRAVYVAAELGVADLLAGGPMTAAQLAQATRVHEPSLYRCCGCPPRLGVLTEQDGRLFALTVLGERLGAEVPASVRLWALLVESLETALGFEPLTELCRQVIGACVPECDLGAESCDDRRIGQAIGRNNAAGSPVPGIMFLVTESEELPGSVLAAYERAASAGFQLACEVDVGRLLAALAAAVPGGGRVLEIGTGVGVGLAWLVHGLGARRDVEVVTVELDDEVQRMALSSPWPPWVRFESGDGAEVVGRLGQFDLIFPDAPGGKIFKLRRTVAALRRGGVLVVDDMDLARHEDERLRSALAVVRHRLLDNAELVCAELGFSSGVIVAVKRRS